MQVTLLRFFLYIYFFSLLFHTLRSWVHYSTEVTTVTLVSKIIQPLHKKSCKPLLFFKLSQYFWKMQFDTFDNRCDVLRTVFWDSHNRFFERLHDSFCVNVLLFLSSFFFFKRLFDFLQKKNQLKTLKQKKVLK